MAKVKKVMLTDVPTLKKEAKVEEAAKLLAISNAGCVVIVENNEPLGIVTELDFVRNLVTKKVGFREPVSKIMSSPVLSMNPNTKLDEALKIIDTKNFRRYPVVDNKKLVGLVTKKDIVHAISDNLQVHRAIQNIVLLVFVLFEMFVFFIYKYAVKFIRPGG